MSAKLLKRNACTVCRKLGSQLACEACQVSYHAHCKHECPVPNPPPVQPDSAPAQPDSAPAPPAPPIVSPACTCGHPEAHSGGCGCTSFACGCGHLWGHGVRPAEKEQHYRLNTLHRAWVLKPVDRSSTRTLEKWFCKGSSNSSSNSRASVDPPPQSHAESDPPPQTHAEPNPPPQPEIPVQQDAPQQPQVLGKCEGYLPKGWTTDVFKMNYPFAYHSSLGDPHRPRGMCWDIGAKLSGLVHDSCTGLRGCRPCAGLEYNQALQKVLELAQHAPSRTPHVCLGFVCIQVRLADNREQMTTLFFEVSNLRRSIEPMTRKNTHQGRVLEAIRLGHVNRAATTLNAAHKRGYGVARLADFVENAVQANAVHYGADVMEAAITVYRMSGLGVLRILSKMGFFPQEGHVARMARALTFPVGAVACLDGVLSIWAALPACPITHHMDEIAIVPRLVVDKDNRIQGLCECAGEVFFNCVDDLVPVAQNLQEKKWHIATYARVAALSRHDRTNYGCVAISAVASCNRFTAEEEARRVTSIEDMWEKYAATHGPLVVHAADADSRHRSALYSRTKVHFWGADFSLLQVRVGAKDSHVMISVDMRHICKRFVRRILGQGWCINTVHITATILVQLAKALHVGKGLEVALKEKDFMSVRAALDVMLAIAEIGGVVDVARLDPSMRAMHAAVRALHWFVLHTYTYYFHNKRPLGERLLHAAKASLHLLVLQHQTNVLSAPLYVDFQTEFSTIFCFVDTMKELFPDASCFVCLHGNDRIENLFSIVRTARGSGGVLDIVQLRHRLACAAQIEEFLAARPGMRRERRRGVWGDNINPVTAGLPHTVSTVDLRRLWQQAFAEVDAEVAISLRGLAESGVGTHSPHGQPLNAPMDVPRDEAGPGDRDGDQPLDEGEGDEEGVDFQETDELEHTFENSDLIDLGHGARTKQSVLNEMFNCPLGDAPRDRLSRAMQKPRDGIAVSIPSVSAAPRLPARERGALQIPFQPDADEMPVVGDLFAAVGSFRPPKQPKGTPRGEREISVAFFWLRNVTSGSQRAMDVSTTVIEGAGNLTVHGSWLPFEYLPAAKLYVWCGTICTCVVTFPGVDVLFVKLDANETGKWYTTAERMHNLARWCLGKIPKVIPPINRLPYADIPVSIVPNQKLTTDAAPSVKCPICSNVVQKKDLRTHVGQHWHRGECVPGDDTKPLVTFCGLCGRRGLCELHEVQGRQYKMYVVSNCSFQPPGVQYSKMPKRSDRSPCSDHPIRCLVCKLPLWSYTLKAHYEECHPLALFPSYLYFTPEEKDEVLNWVPHDGRGKKKRWVPPMTAIPTMMLPHCLPHPLWPLRSTLVRAPALAPALALVLALVLVVPAVLPQIQMVVAARSPLHPWASASRSRKQGHQGNARRLVTAHHLKGSYTKHFD